MVIEFLLVLVGSHSILYHLLEPGLDELRIFGILQLGDIVLSALFDNSSLVFIGLGDKGFVLGCINFHRLQELKNGLFLVEEGDNEGWIFFMLGDEVVEGRQHHYGFGVYTCHI